MRKIEQLLNETKNKKLLLIYPHPDDESFSSGGLILLAKRMGYHITLITLTKGGAGKIHINPRGNSLKELRVKELKKATKILGIDDLIIKDFDDGKIRVRNGWSNWLVSIIGSIKPGVIVTYDHTGITGHPDHIGLSLFVKDVLEKDINKSKIVLLWPVLDGILKEYLIPPKIASFSPSHNYLKHLTFLDVIKKIRAINSHKSQIEMKWWIEYLIMLVLRKEWYHKVELNRNYPYKYIPFDI